MGDSGSYLSLRTLLLLKIGKEVELAGWGALPSTGITSVKP